MLQGLRLVPSALLHRLHDTCLESADLTFDRCPAKGFPCPVPVQGCTSLRRHLLTLLADLPSSLVMEDQGKVCPLSRRVMSPPVSKPLQLGLRFLPHPLPALPSARLTARLPSREQYGLTVFRMCDRNGIGPSFFTGGGLSPMTGENGAPVPAAFRSLTAPLAPSFLTILAEVCLR